MLGEARGRAIWPAPAPPRPAGISPAARAPYFASRASIFLTPSLASSA